MTTPKQRSRARLAEALASLDDTVTRLSELSERAYRNPYTAVAWPDEVRPAEQWFSAPEYVSLHGTERWERLDGASRRRLAFLEAANFYSLNIHGEKSLIRGLAERLYREDLVRVAPYLHHFLDEENKHSVYFGRFCTRYAKVYRSRQLAFEQSRPRDIEDFLFFTKTMIFEEVVDRYNRVQARDERLHPVARFINANHHFEESRHLIFGRRLVAALWEASRPDWDDTTVSELRGELEQFIVASWREYYNPDVYSDAGLDAPWDIAEEAWSAPAQREHRRQVSQKVLTFLRGNGILREEPTHAF